MLRARTGTARALAVGSAVSGLLAYVFFSIVTRALGAEEAAPVSVLWTYWSASAAVLTFPLQHWIARSVAASGSEDPVHDALPRLALVVIAIAGAATVAGWAGREVLFHRGDALFPALLGAVTVGSAFIGLVRGGLSARRQFDGVAWALVGENGLRCLGAVALVLLGVRTAGAYGLVLAAGPAIGLLWPESFRFGRGQTPDHRESPLSFLGNVAGGSLLGQLVLTGGPVALALLGGAPADVTALFATLALFRAPYTLALGLVAPLTGRLTAMVVEGRAGQLRRLVYGVSGAALVGGLAAGLIGSVVGGAMTRAVFGADIRLPAALTGLVVAGSVVALGNLVLTLALVARTRAAVVLRCWVAACTAGAAAVALAGDPLLAVVAGFLTAEVTALLLMALDHVVGEDRGPAVSVGPGSSR